MKVKLSFLEKFSTDFKGASYEIYQFANPITFEIINGVNLDLSIKLIPYEIYKCTIERKGKKWRVTEVTKD